MKDWITDRRVRSGVGMTFEFVGRGVEGRLEKNEYIS